MRRLLFILAFVLALVAPAPAQDSRGELVTTTPSYQGQTASAPIPTSMHVRNERDAGGSGMCVISSVLIDGVYQGVPGLDMTAADGHRGHGSQFWATAKSRNAGGYGPAKLQSLAEEVMPGEHYASYVGTDPAILDTLSRTGYPVGATMNTGALYGYKYIHHMVSLAHYRTGGWACVVDNNDPGRYHWMPASEFARRWVDGRYGWAWIWTRLPAAQVGSMLMIAIAAVAVIALQRRRRESLS